MRVEPRSHWNALGATGAMQPLNLNAITGWSVHWLGKAYPAGMTDHQIMKAVQLEHTSGRGQRGLTNFSDIGYNFAIGRQRQGLIFEGRGDKFVGAHTAGHNSRYLGLVFLIGEGERPTTLMLERADWLISGYHDRYGVPKVVHPHSANVPTACPGDALRLWARQYTKTGTAVTTGAVTAPVEPTPPSLFGGDDMTPTQREAVGRIQAAVNQSGYRPPLVVDQDPGPKTAVAVEALSKRVDPLNIAGRLRQLLKDVMNP